MRRIRWLAFSQTPAAHKLLNIYAEPSVHAVVGGNSSLIQRSWIHFPTAANVNPYMEKHTDFVLLSLKSFFHATGVCQAAERDYYDILGVSRDANRDEIKKAFHAMAKKYHPDANKNNPSVKRKFQEMRDAYETLQDPERRAQYDQMKEGSARTKNAHYSNRREDQFRYVHSSHFSDSFHKIFSEIFENETENLAADVQVEAKLTFWEAVKGCTKHLSFEADVPCDSCYGIGHPLGVEPKQCPTCEGVGKVAIPPFVATCSACKGSGRIIKEFCAACNGSGVCEGLKDAKVTIPEGVDSGDTIRVPGAGNAGGVGRSSGNLFIKLKVADDPIFSREGADIYVDSYISFTQAILGGDVEVPTLSGKTKVRIPKGVQPGQLVLLRGKGLPKSGFFMDHGDHYVRFRINFPLSVTERQHAILEEFEEGFVNDRNANAEGSWWQYWTKHMAGPKFLLEFSVFMLLLIFLNRVLM